MVPLIKNLTAGKFFRQLDRKITDKISTFWMVLAFILVIVSPFLVFASLYMKSFPILREVPLTELLFSSKWQPMAGQFGFLSFILGSVFITALSLLISGPICLLTAIYLTHYSREWFVKIMQPVIDILAGIPSVVYGAWGILVIVPVISEKIAPFFNTQTTGYSLAAGAVVLSIMLIPFILNIMIEILNTIPKELTEATLSLGATRWETIRDVILKKAKPGLISALGLGVSRAFGETIAVLMVAGNVIKLPNSIFDPVYPLPALIANNYGEMMSIPNYDSALMLGALILFITVFLFNLASRITIHRLERKI